MLFSCPPAERQAFLDLSHDPDIIPKIAASIAPKIKGQDDIKMAIACLLFGGSRKVGAWCLYV
jgi:DNA replication licensing factor MCM5